MYCFRCGKKLTGREANCPDCDSPQKRRQRRQKRMVLGLFIFLTGAVVGSLFDTYFFKGDVWKHSFLSDISKRFSDSEVDSKNASATVSPDVKIKMEYKNNEVQSKTTLTEKENFNNYTPVVDNISIPVEGKAKIEVIEKTDNERTELSQKEDYSITGNNEQVPNAVEPLKGLNDNSTLQDEIVQTADDNNENLKNSLDSNDSIESDNTEYANYEPAQDENVDKTPKGHLVFKDISLLESSARNSYHGFMTRDGKELIFASDRTNVNNKPTFQCYVKNMQLEKPVSNKAFSWKGNIWTPEITPDSNMVVFSSDSSLPEHIFLYDRKSKDSMFLTTGKSKNMMPCISPDGKKVAFVSNRGDGKNRIYVLELLNSKKVTQITKGNVDDREPRWTPDGKSIIFTRIVERMKNSKIMKVDVNTLSEVPLVDNNKRNWMADISPDSSILAYTRSLSSDGSKNVIVLQDLNSGKEEILNFPGITDSFRPVWNADGSGFVFHVNTKNGKAIYQANFIRE